MAKSKPASKAVAPIIRNRVKYVASQQASIYGEANTQPSQTIPNQAMSLQEMVNKFTISSEWPKVLPEQHDTPESVGLPDLSMMEKTEIQQLALDVQKDIENKQAQIKLLQEEEFTKVQEQNAALKLAAQQPPKEPDPNQ